MIKPTARPTTARRAPQRPPTATAVQPMVRRNTFVKEKGEEGGGSVSQENEDVQAAPPPGVRFLTDEADQPTVLGDVISFTENNAVDGAEFGNGILDLETGFGSRAEAGRECSVKSVY